MTYRVGDVYTWGLRDEVVGSFNVLSNEMTYRVGDVYTWGLRETRWSVHLTCCRMK